MKRVIIIHGWGGNPDNHWFPWIKKELEEKGFEVHSPSMPNSEHPKMNEWLTHLSNEVKKPDKDTYFIGHSLGCITILRYLETIETEIGGAVFVAGFSKDLGIPEIETFTSNTVNWKSVINSCRKIIAIQSEDDPYTKLRSWDELKENGGEIIIEKDKGHFTDKNEIFQLQSALEAVLKLAGENDD